jgi:hypothetical protein
VDQLIRKTHDEHKTAVVDCDDVEPAAGARRMWFIYDGVDHRGIDHDDGASHDDDNDRAPGTDSD